jgi:hypothetical protein
MNMVLLLGLLFIAIVLTFSIGNEVIVFVFGSKWEPVTKTIYALSGIICACLPFELLRAFYQAKKASMRDFLVLGRGAQYVCLCVSIIISLVIGEKYVLILSAGISAGYITGSALLYFRLYKQAVMTEAA